MIRKEAIQAPTDGDLIRREDAIEAIQTAYCTPCKERGDDYNEVRCRACDYDNAIMQIDALPSAEAEWIPCSERLPKKGEVVLITNGKGNVRCGQFRVVEYEKDGIQHWWWKGNTIETVLAWQPLPEPYKAESEDEE